MRLRDFDTLTFDVVGTLIAFEAGISEWFRPVLRENGVAKTDEDVLAAFAAVEDRCQREAPQKSFTEMLPLMYGGMARRWGMEPRGEDAGSFGR